MDPAALAFQPCGAETTLTVGATLLAPFVSGRLAGLVLTVGTVTGLSWDWWRHPEL